MYTDPSGHLAWVPILAAIGAIATTATYLVTTPSDQINLGDAIVVAGTGAVGGALIGVGVGAVAGAGLLAATSTAAATSSAVATGIVTGAGVGTLAAAEGYLISNAITEQSFDNTDFGMASAFGALEGGLTGMPGISPAQAGAVCLFTGFGESVTADWLNGESANWAAAVAHGTINLVGGYGGAKADELISEATGVMGRPITLHPGRVDLLRPTLYENIGSHALENAIAAARASGRNLIRETIYETAKTFIPK